MSLFLVAVTCALRTGTSPTEACVKSWTISKPGGSVNATNLPSRRRFQSSKLSTSLSFVIEKKSQSMDAQTSIFQSPPLNSTKNRFIKATKSTEPKQVSQKNPPQNSRRFNHGINVSDSISIADAQSQVDQWIKSIGVRYFSELTNLAQLVEEVGELARVISRTYGEQSFKDSDGKPELADEMADVLFVLICLANQTGVDLTEAFQKNLAEKDRSGQRSPPK